MTNTYPNSELNKKHSCLVYFPVSIFATVMGLAGLSLAWHKAYELIAMPAIISEGLRALASLLFVFLFVTYVVKMLRFPAAVHDELAHPVHINFFSTLSIGVLLLATAWFTDMPKTAFVAWGIGTILHLIITIRIINSWIYQTHYEVKHVNPAWFMPVVGNIIVPIVGVKIAPIELSWFFFSVGIVFWLILLTIILNRLFFYEPLPPRLTPTLFILLAPPSVGFIAWLTLVGKLDVFAHILYYTALFLALLLANNATRFLRIPFFISTWAYSFPLAALTIATLQMAKLSGLVIFTWLGSGFLCLVTAVVFALVVRTLIAVWHGEICLPE
jgi:tellurite resistance protein